jgi:hypothetical protein
VAVPGQEQGLLYLREWKGFIILVEETKRYDQISLTQCFGGVQDIMAYAHDPPPLIQYFES